MSSFVSSSTSADKVMSALNKGAAFTSDKWTASEWDAAEKILNPFDARLKNIMLSSVRSLFGVDNVLESDTNYKVLGDQFHTLLCERVVKEKIIKLEQPTKPDTKKGDKKKVEKKKVEKKIDVFKRENSWKIVNTELDSLFERFNTNDAHNMPMACNSKFLEMRALGFMLSAKFLINNKKKFFGKRSKLLFVNNIIVAMQKFLNASRGFEADSIMDSTKKEKICEAFLDIVEKVLIELKTEYQYDGMNVCVDTPQLLIYTDYDHAIPKKISALYDHQTQMINEVYSAIQNDKALLISLRTMTGTGKTTSACGIAEVVNCIRKYTSKKELMFIFCCTLRQVMDQVAQLVFNSGMPFGIASIDPFVGLKEINNYNCKKDVDRVVTVCGPEACIELLKKYPNAVLFLDEPTIGLDHKTDVAKYNVKLISECLPKWTILSSATLPEQLPSWILESHEVKHGDTKYIDIYSNKIHIACEIKTLDGKLMLPHYGVSSASHLEATIERIKANPFVGRTYTSNVGNALYNVISDAGVDGIPDIKAIFDNTDNLNADSLRRISMEMLSTVATKKDMIIQKVCSKIITPRTVDCIEEKSIDDDQDIVWEKAEKFSVGHEINYDIMCTTTAHRYMRPTLIATVDPIDFVHTHFNNIIEDFTTELGTVKQINDNFAQKLTLWQKQVDRSERAMDDSSIKSKEERLRNEDSLHVNKPSLRVNGFQINTIEHLRKYAKNTKNAIDKSAIRTDLDVTEILTVPMDVPDTVRILLACGVGIIGKYSGRYTAFVYSLMGDGKLAYIVADSSIAYGTNVPINNVIVTKDFTDVHSLNTIYQLISRAGRVGRSWMAEAFIPASCAQKMIESIQSDTQAHDVELANLEILHSELVENSCGIDTALIMELAKKQLEEERFKREEEERLRLKEIERLKREEEERIHREQEQQRLEELKKKRSAIGGFGRTVPISNVVNSPPASTVVVTNPASGFMRTSTNGRTGDTKSRFDRLDKSRNSRN
jgi:hypothetical protein